MLGPASPSDTGVMTSAIVDAECMRRLVAEARQGDREAADRLVRQHAAWVRSAIYAVTGRVDLVDDIAQQVWIRVWERLETLQDSGRLRSWLYKVARNAAIDACMSDRRRQDAVGRLEEAPIPNRNPVGPDRIVASSEFAADAAASCRIAAGNLP